LIMITRIRRTECIGLISVGTERIQYLTEEYSYHMFL